MEPREMMLAHLEKLASALDGHGFTGEPAGKTSKPHLKVANAETPSLNERVLCRQADDGSWSFWWPWAQRIGSVDDLSAVVEKIAMVLRSPEGDEAG
jgi:hypothetical protein